jgi:hypothetical protein
MEVCKLGGDKDNGNDGNLKTAGKLRKLKQ